MAHQLAGRVALVTGASSSIGQATAIALAQEGACVAIAAQRKERLDALSQQLVKSGGQALPIIADMTDKEQTQDMVEQTYFAWGRLDILVNNASVMLLGSIEDADTDDWQRMVSINFLGVMYATHAVLPLMKAQGQGHIVNISSITSHTVYPEATVYCATKFGASVFLKGLHQEVYKNNIRVTAIKPSIVMTQLYKHITAPKVHKVTEERYYTTESPQAEDIAAAIVYAVSQPPRVSVSEILLCSTR